MKAAAVRAAAPAPGAPPRPARHAGRRIAAWAAAALVLGAVFAAYLDPHTVVDLANRAWSCF